MKPAYWAQLGLGLILVTKVSERSYFQLVARFDRHLTPSYHVLHPLRTLHVNLSIIEHDIKPYPAIDALALDSTYWIDHAWVSTYLRARALSSKPNYSGGDNNTQPLYRKEVLTGHKRLDCPNFIYYRELASHHHVINMEPGAQYSLSTHCDPRRLLGLYTMSTQLVSSYQASAAAATEVTLPGVL